MIIIWYNTDVMDMRKNRKAWFIFIFSIALLAAGSFAFGFFKSSATVPKATIQELTSVFENDTIDLQYGYCENIDDGRGMTFGIAGFCSGTYDGNIFLKEYRRLEPDNRLVKYIPVFDRIDASVHDKNGCSDDTEGLEDFPADFAACREDPMFIWAQRYVADRLYWYPSQKIAESIGAAYNITRGELYDAYINHGEDGTEKLIKATDKITGGRPASGINEKKWLSAFLRIRLAVLKADPCWREAADRIYVYRKLLSQDNLDLDTPFALKCYGDEFIIK